MASEGFAGLQPTAWGKGDPALLRCLAEDCLLGLVVLGIRVIFHLGQDVWCIVFFFFFPRPGPHFYYSDDHYHSSGSCTQPPGDLPVDFFLPGRTLCP